MLAVGVEIGLLVKDAPLMPKLQLAFSRVSFVTFTRKNVGNTAYSFGYNQKETANGDLAMVKAQNFPTKHPTPSLQRALCRGTTQPLLVDLYKLIGHTRSRLSGSFHDHTSFS